MLSRHWSFLWELWMYQLINAYEPKPICKRGWGYSFSSQDVTFPVGLVPHCRYKWNGYNLGSIWSVAQYILPIVCGSFFCGRSCLPGNQLSGFSVPYGKNSSVCLQHQDHKHYVASQGIYLWGPCQVKPFHAILTCTGWSLNTCLVVSGVCQHWFKLLP